MPLAHIFAIAGMVLVIAFALGALGIALALYVRSERDDARESRTNELLGEILDRMDAQPGTGDYLHDIFTVLESCEKHLFDIRNEPRQ